MYNHYLAQVFPIGKFVKIIKEGNGKVNGFQVFNLLCDNNWSYSVKYDKDTCMRMVTVYLPGTIREGEGRSIEQAVDNVLATLIDVIIEKPKPDKKKTTTKVEPTVEPKISTTTPKTIIYSDTTNVTPSTPVQKLEVVTSTPEVQAKAPIATLITPKETIVSCVQSEPSIITEPVVEQAPPPSKQLLKIMDTFKIDQMQATKMLEFYMKYKITNRDTLNKYIKAWKPEVLQTMADLNNKNIDSFISWGLSEERFLADGE